MTRMDFLEQAWEVDCIGCAIGSGRMTPPGGVLAESGTFYVHQDPEVPLPGFLILAPRQHVGSLNDLTPGAYTDFCLLLRRSRMALGSLPGLRSVTLIQEERPAGSQPPGHFHLWLFPWYDWMIEKYGSQALTHIRACMAYAKTTLNTPQQRQLTLAAAARLKVVLAEEARMPPQA